MNAKQHSEIKKALQALLGLRGPSVQTLAIKYALSDPDSPQERRASKRLDMVHLRASRALSVLEELARGAAS